MTSIRTVGGMLCLASIVGGIEAVAVVLKSTHVSGERPMDGNRDGFIGARN